MVTMADGDKYLLDTCVCIALIKKQPHVVERIRAVGISNCKISELTLAELYFGAYKSGRIDHFEDVAEIANLFEQYPVSYSLRKYGDIRWALEHKGQKLDSIDLFIGATAIQHEFILVTGNVKHFERIPGLKFENWME